MRGRRVVLEAGLAMTAALMVGAASAPAAPAGATKVDPATMPAVADPKALQLKPADMAWWREAKFGMFIHWGLYAIPAQGEWYMNDKKVPAEEYRKLADQFHPQHYDPAVWAQIAKDAGMKYMVLTARHHDGFALWDSPASYQNFDAVHSAAKKDLVAPFLKAARDAGMRLGLYYSPMDWRFPGYFDPKGQADNAALMKKQAWGQIEELVSNYGQIDILWYDGGWLAMKGSDADAEPFWESNKIAAMVRAKQPKVIMSPRSGWLGDFAVDEGSTPVTGNIKDGPWEKAMNLNDTAWGFTTQQNLLARDRVLNTLVNTVVRGGNFLLNVGPDADGVIPEAHVARLKEIGEWMKKYGESIYGTTAGPFQPRTNQFGATFKDKTIYVHVLSWRPVNARGRAAGPETDSVTLPVIKQKVLSVECLTGGTPTFSQTTAGVTVTLPVANHDALDTILVMKCDAAVAP